MISVVLTFLETLLFDNAVSLLVALAETDLFPSDKARGRLESTVVVFFIGKVGTEDSLVSIKYN